MNEHSETGSIVRSEPRRDVRLSFPDGVVLSGARGLALERFVLAWQLMKGESVAPITAAVHEGAVRELDRIVEHDAPVIPLDITTVDGMRVYKRSLSFVLVVAAAKLFPQAQISVDHSFTANGFFCTVAGRPDFSPAELDCLASEMDSLVVADSPIVRRRMSLSDATTVFAAQGYEDKVRLLRFNPLEDLEVHELGGVVDAFYGPLVPHTGYLRSFRLQPQEGGFVILFPLTDDPTRFPGDTSFPKLARSFRESCAWQQRVGAEDVGALNAAVERGDMRELVLVAEALHERRIGEIAVSVASRPGARLVFIAGPTSSGKTTFAKRLGIQLSASGVQSYAIGLDDYFLDRQRSPRDEDGQLDFETFDALDQPLFHEHMLRLLAGETVRLPRFDFLAGNRVSGSEVSLPKGPVLLIEGIHGLNPLLLPGVPREALVKIYVSCLAQINVDRHNHIATSDARLLRRIVRDAVFRGHSAEATILRWQSVRRGERRYVFPYQEEADHMFNSSLPYEISVLKDLVEPLLLRYDHASIASLEAQRLLQLLALFVPADPDYVPDNSILREFIGGSIMENVRLAGPART